MKKGIFLVSILILFQMPGIQLAASAQEHKKIVVLGSSSAFGYFGNPPLYPQDSAWAYRVKNYFKNLGIIDTLYNLGVSGTNPYSAMPSSYIPPPNRPQPDPQHNITKALSYNPDVIIVNFPSNQYDWMPFEEVINCLQTIRDSALEKNIPCYITTTQPRNGFSFTERQRLKELKEIILSTFGVYAIDFFSPIVDEPDLKIRAEYDLGDGVHLNAAGHAVLFDMVLEADIFYFTIPVQFGPLFAKRQEEDILVNWQVFYENDVDKYTIECSPDGINFTNAGTVASVGNTTQSRVYNFIDRNVEEDIRYYRISVNNIHGKTTYSERIRIIAALDFEGSDHFYPTITNSDIFLVHYSGSHNVNSYITGIDGRRYMTDNFRLEPGMVRRINVQRLRAGSYFYTIEQGGYKKTWKFLKL